jgi:8-oxo-dGTP pyrophosphatase MutT (NUDIX family)
MTKIVCAAFVHNRKVLLVRRATHRNWHPNQWDLVGGHVDRGEKFKDALVRECMEEVGLRPTSFEVKQTLFETDNPKKKTPFRVYAVTGWTGKDAQLLGDEHSELGWFSWEQVKGMDVALVGYRAIIEQLLRDS